MKRYGLCARCRQTPLVSGMIAYMVNAPAVSVRLDGSVTRSSHTVLWCQPCGERP